MFRSRITRSLATAVAVGVLGVAGAATPAMALPIDNVTFDTAKVDYGNSWAGQAPTSAAQLDWSNANGATCLTGNIFMKNAAGLKSKVELELYPDSIHPAGGENPIATMRSTTKTAVGIALNVFSANPPCVNTTATHAHVRLLDDTANPGGALQQSAIAFHNE